MFVLDLLSLQVIRNHPPALDSYMKRLIDEKHLSQEEVSDLQNNVFRILNEEFDKSKEYVPSTRDWLAAYWQGFKGPEQLSRIRNTGYAFIISVKYFSILLYWLQGLLSPFAIVPYVYDMPCSAAGHFDGSAVSLLL